MKNIFLERFKELLNEKFDGNKSKLSKVSKIPASTLTQYFPPRNSTPSAKHIVLLSTAFECSADYLLGLEDDFGNIKINKTNELSYREQKLLKSFSILDNDEKDKIIEDCEYFANKHTKLNAKRA